MALLIGAPVLSALLSGGSRRACLTGSCLTWAWACYLISQGGDWGNAYVGLDTFSSVFVLLTAFVFPVALVSVYPHAVHRSANLWALLMTLESVLLLTFTARDLILFYLSFETVLIPLFILIGTHGSTAGRGRAAMLLFMFTLSGSLAMLMAFISLSTQAGTTDMVALSLITSDSTWVWVGIALSLCVKTPIVPLHGWLFRAHSESNLAGSIVLAGVVLKLSVYAYYRILVLILPSPSVAMMPVVLTLCIVSLIHGSLATLRQVDLKVFIAYSSVGHMAVTLMGVASLTPVGLQGALLLSIAHGMISPALFILVTALYERYHSRVIRYYSGLQATMPTFRWLLFVTTVCSMGLPATLNWLGELYCICAALTVSTTAGLFAALTVILGATYSFWLYSSLATRPLSPFISLLSDLSVRETTMVVSLVAVTVIMGVVPLPSFL